MTSPRLELQFIRLWQAFQGKATETTLQELAQTLHCTRRHVRSLLNKMQEIGWINWQAEVGRGKKSTLIFHSNALEIQQNRAERLIAENDIEKLVALMGDKDSVRQMVLSQIEKSFHPGQQLLRIIYYRPFRNLLPGTPLRRSELHLMSQIFNSLVHLKEENGEVEAELAHHWQMITEQHWRFYLRPSIYFHHGRELTLEDISASLMRMKHCNLLYAHIEQISSPQPYELDIFLSEADKQFATLLGSPQAVILPQEWASLPSFAQHPIGTGAYQVIANDKHKLQIKAFNRYFGLRALLDEIDIWVVPELNNKMVCSTIHLTDDDTNKDSLESRKEEGCYFLLYDSRSKQCQQTEIREWLSSVLTPVNMLTHCDPFYQRHWSPAYGLLLHWHHSKLIRQHPKPASLTKLTVTLYKEHHEYSTIADLIKSILSQYEIELTIQVLDYEQWYYGQADSDIWLATVNFYKPLEFSIFAALYELPLFHQCLGASFSQELTLWHQKSLPLEEWCRQLTQDIWLYPLFHHLLELQGQRTIRGVKMNTFGWFDFKSAWFTPDIDTPKLK
ncbi:HTH-type transcriptional regulator SgrR [Proteus terrae]|uniref:HTH-type transcriptional regulator SgrR n=1 Tax=Proteus terrae TaxID=1574161 RepID=UPI000D68E9E3|nr:HTH-type transcriptional regulator SgrR [Proteus terrae]